MILIFAYRPDFQRFKVFLMQLNQYINRQNKSKKSCGYVCLRIVFFLFLHGLLQILLSSWKTPDRNTATRYISMNCSCMATVNVQVSSPTCAVCRSSVSSLYALYGTVLENKLNTKSTKFTWNVPCGALALDLTIYDYHRYCLVARRCLSTQLKTLN